MTLDSKVYDVLKWVCMLVLPALATLIIALGGIWSIPYAEQVSRTIVAVNAFLAAILGLSSATYYKGNSNATND